MPPSSGILTSRSATAGRSSSISRSASMPSPVSPTSSSSGAATTARTSTSRYNGWSSATTTRTSALVSIVSRIAAARAPDHPAPGQRAPRVRIHQSWVLRSHDPARGNGGAAHNLEAAYAWPECTPRSAHHGRPRALERRGVPQPPPRRLSGRGHGGLRAARRALVALLRREAQRARSPPRAAPLRARGRAGPERARLLGADPVRGRVADGDLDAPRARGAARARAAWAAAARGRGSRHRQGAAGRGGRGGGTALPADRGVRGRGRGASGGRALRLSGGAEAGQVGVRGGGSRAAQGQPADRRRRRADAPGAAVRASVPDPAERGRLRLLELGRDR